MEELSKDTSLYPKFALKFANSNTLKKNNKEIRHNRWIRIGYLYDAGAAFARIWEGGPIVKKVN